MSEPEGFCDECGDYIRCFVASKLCYRCQRKKLEEHRENAE